MNLELELERTGDGPTNRKKTMTTIEKKRKLETGVLALFVSSLHNSGVKLTKGEVKQQKSKDEVWMAVNSL